MSEIRTEYAKRVLSDSTEVLRKKKLGAPQIPHGLQQQQIIGRGGGSGIVVTKMR
jgi:hypothetical protein